MSKRNKKKYPKEDYDEILEKYQELRGVELQGSEFKPLQQDIKTMFMNGRNKEDILDFMEWLESSNKMWTNSWKMSTVKKGIPDWVGGRFKEEKTFEDEEKVDASRFEKVYRKRQSHQFKEYPNYGREDTGIMEWLIETGAVIEGTYAVRPRLYSRFAKKMEAMGSNRA